MWVSVCVCVGVGEGTDNSSSARTGTEVCVAESVCVWVWVRVQTIRAARALKLQPKRTIRMIFWTAEEIGSLGGKAYFDAKTELPVEKLAIAIELDFGVCIGVRGGGGREYGVGVGVWVCGFRIWCVRGWLSVHYVCMCVGVGVGVYTYIHVYVHIHYTYTYIYIYT